MGGTGHTYFFIYCKDQAQRTMGKILLNEEHRNGNSHPVISTQARPISRKRLAIPFDGNRIFQRIIRASWFSHTDHIHMALYNRQRHIFISFCRRHIGNDVVDFILNNGSTELTKPGSNIVTDFFFMT